MKPTAGQQSKNGELKSPTQSFTTSVDAAPAAGRDFSWLGALFRIACWSAEIFGIGCAIYLTLRKSSNLRTVWWIPYPVARWADYHGRVRNLFAYAILALPVLLVVRNRRSQLKWMATLGLMGTALEYGQLFIPTRWFEWQDIALSLAGLLSAWIIVEAVRSAGRVLAPNRPSHFGQSHR